MVINVVAPENENIDNKIALVLLGCSLPLFVLFCILSAYISFSLCVKCVAFQNVACAKVIEEPENNSGHQRCRNRGLFLYIITTSV